MVCTAGAEDFVILAAPCSAVASRQALQAPKEYVDFQPLPADLQQLSSSLRRLGVDVRLVRPPRKGVYGIYEAKTRQLWVASLAFE